MVWFHQPCLPSPISMLFLSLIFPLWSLNLWSTSNNWKLHLKTSDSVSSRTCPVLSNRFRMRFSASLQSSTTNHLALRIQCLCRCDEIEGPHKVSDFILTFAIWGLISIVLGLCWSHPIRCRVFTSQWLFRTVLASPSRRYVRLIECNEAHENEAYQDPTGGLSINKHIAQLLDVPLSTITDYFPSKLEFNTALWHYFPVTTFQWLRKIWVLREMASSMGYMNIDPGSFLTCLIQSRPGLQVQNHMGEWIIQWLKVQLSVILVSLLCSAFKSTLTLWLTGMQLMLLTGGKLVATTHRVNTLKIDEDR